MSHQRYPSHDAVKEPHSVSLKVLRLSRPSLVTQYPLHPPFASPTAHPPPSPIPASLAYSPNGASSHDDRDVANLPPSPSPPTNPTPFVLSPILNLPPSFGSAYVGETFSCTLCANHEIPAESAASAPLPSTSASSSTSAAAAAAVAAKTIRDVRIEAEMKSPSSPAPVKLSLLLPAQPHPADPAASTGGSSDGGGATGGAEAADLLEPGSSLQRVLAFDLKEEGNHVLAVTVSYYEASPLSGRARSFRKLYQFVCKPALIVRTKPGALAARHVLRGRHLGRVGRGSGGGGGGGGRPEDGSGGGGPADGSQDGHGNRDGEGEREREREGGFLSRRWVLEAQLENCSEEAVLLERVGLELEPGLGYEDCNGWSDEVKSEDASGGYGSDARDEEDHRGERAGGPRRTREQRRRPVLQPGETEQVCFVIEEEQEGAAVEVEGRVVFGILQIGWRTEMGNRGFLSTGKLGTRFVNPRERKG